MEYFISFGLISVKFHVVAEFSALWRNRAVKKQPVICPKFTCESLPFVNLGYFFGTSLRIRDKYAATELVPVYPNLSENRTTEGSESKV